MAKIFWALFISMVPIVELRGALPIAYASGIPIVLSYLLTVIGNCIPIPFLIIFGKRVLDWFASFEKFGKPFRKIIEVGESKAAKINPNALFWGLFAFVAVPLPGTGAWTGCLISMLLGLDLKKAFPPIALGVVTSGLIVSAIVLLVESGVKWLNFFI